MPTYDLTPRDLKRLLDGSAARRLSGLEQREQVAARREARAKEQLARAKAGIEGAGTEEAARAGLLRIEQMKLRSAGEKKDAQKEFGETVADILEKHGVSRAAARNATVLRDEDGVPTGISLP